jgi:hypothetical protein
MTRFSMPEAGYALPGTREHLGLDPRVGLAIGTGDEFLRDEKNQRQYQRVNSCRYKHAVEEAMGEATAIDPLAK